MKSTRQPRLFGEARRAKAYELREKYLAGPGCSIRNLADSTGYSFGTVRNLLRLAKTPLRPRGGRRRPLPDGYANGGILPGGKTR